MVKVSAKRANGDVIGSAHFSASQALSSLFTWLADTTGLRESSFTLCFPSGKTATSEDSASSTIASFVDDANDNAEVVVTVETRTSTAAAAVSAGGAGTTVPAQRPAQQPLGDANELIRSLFRQSAAVSAAPATSPALGRAAPLARPTAAATAAGSAGGDPDFDPRSRSHLPPEEQARLATLDENLAAALEFSPEQFGVVQMLFVKCEINKSPVTVFVDSGAQSTFISAAAAAQCDLHQLIDSRAPFVGIAQGVGEQKILGTIHMIPVNVSGLFLPFSFRVLEHMPYDVILGLDQLRRHQMVINLADGHLHIGDIALPFLSEWEVAEAARAKDAKKDAAATAPPPTVAAPAPAPTPAPPPAESAVSEQDEKIQQLMAFTGVENVADARQLLEASGWDLEDATALFFEG